MSTIPNTPKPAGAPVAKTVSPPAPAPSTEPDADEFEGAGPVASYSSAPIARYTFGRFRFEGTVLNLMSQDDVNEFESALKNAPPSEQARIKKLDVKAAERIVRERLKQGGATKGIDSATGDRATDSPKVGTTDLSATNPAEKPAE